MTSYLLIEGERLAWQSESQAKVPKNCIYVDDTLRADEALRLARAGTAMLWQGDFQNAKQLLAAMARKIDSKKPKIAPTAKEQFHLYRLAQAQKAQILGMLLIRIESDFTVVLKRAPDIRLAAQQVWHWQEPFVVSLRELLGIIGAYEWRKNGVSVPVLGDKAKIYPYYGVFSPIRGEYLDLVATTPLPATCRQAMEIGVGTGVLSAILAKRGVELVIATDIADRAIECARFNIAQLGYADKVRILKQAFFPQENVDLIVCNPPWLPAKASTSLEAAVYDPDSQMLKGFLSGVANHLNSDGQAWLIISDLAERLGLRAEGELLGWIEAAGLLLAARYDTRPKHKKAQESMDPLSQARREEVTSLWVLKKYQPKAGICE